jgi:hypothetical protein
MPASKPKWLKKAIERLRGDNEATDGTDAAHPSYWRGCDATFAAMSEQLRKILDGEDDCAGVCNEPWDTLRRRVLTLREEVAQLNECESDIEKDWHKLNAYIATAVGPNTCHSAYELVDALVARTAKAKTLGAVEERDLWIKHADMMCAEMLNGSVWVNPMLALSARVALEKMRNTEATQLREELA